MPDAPNEGSKGLGDSVEKFIKKATGGRVKTCGGCKKRRDWLNRMVPYAKKEGEKEEEPKGCDSCEEKKRKRREFNKKVDPSNFHIED